MRRQEFNYLCLQRIILAEVNANSRNVSHAQLRRAMKEAGVPSHDFALDANYYPNILRHLANDGVNVPRKAFADVNNPRVLRSYVTRLYSFLHNTIDKHHLITLTDTDMRDNVARYARMLGRGYFNVSDSLPLDRLTPNHLPSMVTDWSNVPESLIRNASQHSNRIMITDSFLTPDELAARNPRVDKLDIIESLSNSDNQVMHHFIQAVQSARQPTRAKEEVHNLTQNQQRASREAETHTDSNDKARAKQQIAQANADAQGKPEVTRRKHGTYHVDSSAYRLKDNKPQPISTVIKMMAPYLSNKDLINLQSSVNGRTKIKAPVISRMLYTLRYLNDTGADFDVVADNYTNFPRINARITDTHNQIRLIDTDPRYVGAVITGQGKMSYSVRGNKLPKPDDLIDYAVGNRDGVIIHQFRRNKEYKNGKQVSKPGHNLDTATIYVGGSRTPITYDLYSYRTTHQTRADMLNRMKHDYGNSAGYLKDKIGEAYHVYSKYLLGPEIKDDTDPVYKGQQELYHLADEEGFSRDDVRNASKMMSTNSAKGLTDQQAKAYGTILQGAYHLSQAEIGDYDNGFDPMLVGNLVDSVDEANSDNSIMVALSDTGYDRSKFKGDPQSRVKLEDYLVRFDPNNVVVNAGQKGNPNVQGGTFELKEADKIQRYLVHSGIAGLNGQKAPQVAIDKNGVVKWSGQRRYYRWTFNRNARAGQPKFSLKPTGQPRQVSGEIGQIFAPDKHGIINTHFASGDNFSKIPGYKAFFQYKGLDKGLNRAQRMRVRGYTQMLDSRIRENLREQLMRPGVGDLTSPRDDAILGGIYHSELSGERVPLNWYDKSIQIAGGTSQAKRDVNARLHTMESQISFDKRIGSITSDLDKGSGDDPRAKLCDNQSPRYMGLNGVHNPDGSQKMVNGKPAVNGYVFDHILDPNITSDGKEQGLKRYGVPGIKLEQQDDGTYAVKPSKTHKYAAVAELPYLKYQKYNGWDRKQSAGKYLLGETYSMAHTNVALSTFGGFNFEDATAISKDFADKHKVPALDGDNHPIKSDSKKGQVMLASGRCTVLKEDPKDKVGEVMRPLKAGDKLTDMGYNKATVSIVVDPNMDPKLAKQQHLTNEVKFFKQNPVGVVMSPYGHINRDNPGVDKEMAHNGVHTAKIDGKPVCTYAPANLMVTKLTADHQNTIYDKHARQEGKARKVSSQMVWGLDALGAHHIVKHVFAHNDRAWSKLREYLIATGIDMDKAGTLHMGYHPHQGEVRKVYNADPKAIHQRVVNFHGKKMSIPQKGVKGAKTITDDGSAGVKADRNFLRQISDKGGLLHLPFQVKMMSGVKTNNLPVMSSRLRRNVRVGNGKLNVSDYNRYYMKIFDAASKYTTSAEQAEKDKKASLIKAGKPVTASALKQAVSDAHRKIQHTVQNTATQMQKRIINDHLGGLHGQYNKHCIFRDDIMARYVGHSATATSDPDPRLDINTIAVSPHIYHTLGMDKHPNDMVMVHRDPVLHDGSIRGFHVKMDKRLTGFALNPANDASFDMDHDGDTCGIINVGHDKGVQADLRKMAPSNQLVNTSTHKPTSYLDVSMDMISGAMKRHIVTPKIAGLPSGRQELHKFWSHYKTPQAKRMAEKGIMDKNRKIFGKNTDAVINEVIKKNPSNEAPGDQLSDKFVNIASEDPQKRAEDTTKLTHECLRNYGSATWNNKNRETIKQSMNNIINVQQAKSSPKMGRRFLYFYDGKSTPSDDYQMEGALAAKADMTGVSGAKAQQLMSAIRDKDPKTALDATYVATQANLQGKHHVDRIPQIKKLLCQDYPRVFKGKTIYGSPRHGTATIPEMRDSLKTMFKDSHVDVGNNVIDKFTNDMRAGKSINERPLKDVKDDEGALLDKAAYSGGGYSAILDGAANLESLAQGSLAGEMAPKSIRENYEARQTIEDKTASRSAKLHAQQHLIHSRDTTLSRDTQDTKRKQEQSKSLNANYQKLSAEGQAQKQQASASKPSPTKSMPKQQVSSSEPKQSSQTRPASHAQKKPESQVSKSQQNIDKSIKDGSMSKIIERVKKHNQAKSRANQLSTKQNQSTAQSKSKTATQVAFDKALKKSKQSQKAGKSNSQEATPQNNSSQVKAPQDDGPEF